MTWAEGRGATSAGDRRDDVQDAGAHLRERESASLHEERIGRFHGGRLEVARHLQHVSRACFHPVITSDETTPSASPRSSMAVIRSKYDVPSGSLSFHMPGWSVSRNAHRAHERQEGPELFEPMGGRTPQHHSEPTKTVADQPLCSCRRAGGAAAAATRHDVWTTRSASRWLHSGPHTNR